MKDDAKALVGTWTKTTRSSCSETYPDRLEFRDNGQYRGSKTNPGDYTVWDVGTFRIVDPTHIKISTATDEIIAYEFKLAGDTLSFVDPQTCSFAYQRART